VLVLAVKIIYALRYTRTKLYMHCDIREQNYICIAIYAYKIIYALRYTLTKLYMHCDIR